MKSHVIGGHLAWSCLKCSSAIPHFVLKLHKVTSIIFVSFVYVMFRMCFFLCINLIGLDLTLVTTTKEKHEIWHQQLSLIIETYRKVMNWRETLVFPVEMPITNTSKNLILSLCTDAEHRLGRHHQSIDDIQTHHFFRGVDWDNIR